MLNRFSKDIGQMDDLLPFTFYDYCRVGFICDISKMLLLNSSTLDELGSWCLKVGEGVNWSSGRKEVSMATMAGATTNGTVTLTRSVKYLATRHSPELGMGEGGLRERAFST